MLKTGMIIAERYEILGKIGTGGMADVYKAKDHKLNRFVAVKVLKQEFREDTTFIRKFRSEAQAAAGLTHPNIVNVFDVGDDDGVYYIVMELIEGITLKEYIAKKGKLSIKEATSIAIQVSMGLEAAHNHGIVHRDVKAAEYYHFHRRKGKGDRFRNCQSGIFQYHQLQRDGICPLQLPGTGKGRIQ